MSIRRLSQWLSYRMLIRPAISDMFHDTLARYDLPVAPTLVFVDKLGELSRAGVSKDDIWRALDALDRAATEKTP